MQPSYATADIHRRHHHNQQFLQNNECCSSVFPNPTQNLNHSYQSELVHSVPISYQLFHQQQQHFGSPLPSPEERLHPQIGQHHHQPLPHPPFSPVKFKLGLHKNGGNNEHNPPELWHPQEDSASIKEPFWKQLSRSNDDKQQCEEEEQHSEGKKKKYCKPVNAQQIDEDNERCKELDNKYRLFGELEAICSLAKVCENNQTASGSALTGENSPKNACPLSIMPFRAVDVQNAGTISAANAGIGVDHGSENSIGEEEAASLKKSQKRMMKKRKLKENLSSMVGFFENLVKQVMDHQEILHRKFLQVIDRMDKERKEREQEWRRQEAVKYNKEAITRAHEQSLASSREAEIVSYIGKITGQSIDLPARKAPLLLQPEIHQTPTKELKRDSHSRWPKAEVGALIQVRSSIETKFQEPGLKGPLWEEVSSLMGSMGYLRSAKRCKEKWENINKYFRKAKESSKKRSQQSKTCAYFNQLGHLYSRTSINSPKFSSVLLNSSEIGLEKHNHSELLKAFIANSTNPCFENKKVAELIPSGLECDGIITDKIEERSHDQVKEDHEDDYDMDSDDEEEEI